MVQTHEDGSRQIIRRWLLDEGAEGVVDAAADTHRVAPADFRHGMLVGLLSGAAHDDVGVGVHCDVDPGAFLVRDGARV